MAEPRKILVIMLRRIGDVVLTTPAVRALKKRWPKAELHFLAEPPGAEALRGDPDIDRVWAYAPRPGESAAAAYVRWLLELRRERYDWVVDFLGTPRSAILTFATGAALRAGPSHVWHRWAYNRPLVQSEVACYGALEKIRVLKAIDPAVDDSDFLPRFHIPQDELEEGRRAVAALWPGWTGPIIGLVPASRKGTREWPAERYAELARRLAASAGARCVVFWGPGEEETARAVAAAAPGAAKASPKTADLKCLGALLSACRLVVTNCNGPKHIAVARGVPTVTVHGSSDPVCWNPPQPGPKGPESPLGHPRHLVVRRDELSCIGCRQNDCPLGTTECLRDLSAERVERAALSLLGAEAKLP